MKRADVFTYYDYDRLPAVNVKVHGVYGWERHAAEVAEENHDPGFTREWCETHVSENQATTLFEWACESGWDLLQQDVELIWPTPSYYAKPLVTVEAHGRSDGWACVRGLPDVEEWDAVALSKWARFSKWARQQADNIPWSMADLAYLNLYDPWAREQDERQTAADEMLLAYT